MAFDAYFASNMKSGDQPVLRFYGWEPWCISLGYHQNQTTANRELIENDGFEIVRRPTGGNAIFHSEELTYSFIIPGENIDHTRFYCFVHQLIYAALLNLNYDVQLEENHLSDNYLKRSKETFACFNRAAYNEIKFENKKLVGSAQKIYTNAILQHGSILIGRKQLSIIDYINTTSDQKRKYLNILRDRSVCLEQISEQKINEEIISGKILNELKDYSAVTLEIADINSNELKSAMKNASQFRLA